MPESTPDVLQPPTWNDAAREKRGENFSSNGASILSLSNLLLWKQDKVYHVNKR